MKKILFFLASVALLASCSNNEEMEGMVNPGSVQSFDVNIAPFEGDDGTRTNIGNGTNITWSLGDNIGIWPKKVSEGQTVQQLQFNIVNSDVDKATAQFTGTGWGMITDGTYSYYANYPYVAGAQPGEVGFTIQNGLSKNDLGKNDLAWAPQITPTTPEGVNFTFQHLGTLVKFTLTGLPEEMSFSSMKLYSPDGKIFTKTIKFNPAENATAIPTLNVEEKTNVLSVALNNVAPENGRITAYFLALPSEVAGKSFDVELMSVSGKVAYVAHVTLMNNWTSGKLKAYTVEATRLDLGTNLSMNANNETETANSYIISHAGTYNFLADVKGNGKVPTLEGLSTGDVNENVAAIDLTGAKVEVLWETVNTTTAPAVGTIIKSTKLFENRIVIETPETFTEGNALVVVKNKDNEILWSWHIWATATDLTANAQTYGGKTMMDRNLGALANDSTLATADQGKAYGFHYQWGRPFPMVIDTKQKTTLVRTGTWAENAEMTTVDKGTLAYSRKNPAKFIYATTTDDDKAEGSAWKGNWYWGSAPLFWLPAQKSMYDPCPIGWRVPTSTIQWEACLTKDLTTYTTNASCKGRFITDTPSVFYPVSGCRGAYDNAQSGVLSIMGSGLYWSSSTIGVYAGRSMSFNNVIMTPKSSLVRAFGFSVRPEKE